MYVSSVAQCRGMGDTNPVTALILISSFAGFVSLGCARQPSAEEVLVPVFKAGTAIQATHNLEDLSMPRIAEVIAPFRKEMAGLELTVKSRPDVLPYYLEYKKALILFDAADKLQSTLASMKDCIRSK